MIRRDDPGRERVHAITALHDELVRCRLDEAPGLSALPGIAPDEAAAVVVEDDQLGLVTSGGDGQKGFPDRYSLKGRRYDQILRPSSRGWSSPHDSSSVHRPLPDSTDP